MARPASCQHPFPSSSYTDGSHRVALSRPESSEESAAPVQARANVPLHSIRRHAPAVSHTARVNWVLARPISPHLISKRHRAGRARTRPASDLETALPWGGRNMRLLTRVLVCVLDPLHGRSSGRSVRNPPHLTDADEWIDASDPGVVGADPCPQSTSHNPRGVTDFCDGHRHRAHRALQPATPTPHSGQTAIACRSHATAAFQGSDPREVKRTFRPPRST